MAKIIDLEQNAQYRRILSDLELSYRRARQRLTDALTWKQYNKLAPDFSNAEKVSKSEKIQTLIKDFRKAQNRYNAVYRVDTSNQNFNFELKAVA